MIMVNKGKYISYIFVVQNVSQTESNVCRPNVLSPKSACRPKRLSPKRLYPCRLPNTAHKPYGIHVPTQWNMNQQYKNDA